ncbi:hypothetical protein [Cellulomonas sp. ATA003]|uniref:hypothetical protein n=1 Tax=Cellulomonas sp. ATA003 TaxID=3073064 RepID=UPI002873E51A|nr:hypothetical protein [Cellulomonas sp. ATA003]WNB86064.1 hypothetical protein REH70_01880 [Cellulomonas sp. ATA003]
MPTSFVPGQCLGRPRSPSRTDHDVLHATAVATEAVQDETGPWIGDPRIPGDHP